MSDWVRVARAEEVQAETPLAVSLDDDAVVLARLGDDIFALEDLCTHDGSDISGGCIVEVVVDLVWEPPWGPEVMSEAARLELGIF